jgi:UDP-N-acetyl-D-glucosamine dehydrogenase
MLYSQNPITGRKHPIPSAIDDLEAIENFLSHNKNKKVIVVQGLGFVGAVMSLVCANAYTEDYAVIGIDLPTPASFWKIQAINEGEFPLKAEDPNIETLYQAALRNGNLYATFDERAFQFADIIIVDVNLDVKKVSESSGGLSNFDVDIAPL